MELAAIIEQFRDFVRILLRRHGIPREELEDAIQSVWLLACERWVEERRPEPGREKEWIERLVNQILYDRANEREIARVILPAVSLEKPVLATDEESLTIGDLLADAATPDRIATSRETVRELVNALLAVGRAPESRVAREKWRQTVADRLTDHPEIPVEIVCGVCPVCAGPLHRDRAGQRLPHRCPGPWRVVAPANDLPLVTAVPGRWKRHQTCLLCDRPVLRGRVYCTVHKHWGSVRTHSYNYRGQARTIEGGRKHLCAWCGKAWARAHRPYCSLRCTYEARAAKRLQEAER